MTSSYYESDQVSPAMVASHFASQHRGKNKIILVMSEEIISLNQELERLRGHNQHLQIFMDSHGGAEVWELDQAAERIKRKNEAEGERIRTEANLEAHKLRSSAEQLQLMRELRSSQQYNG